MHFVLVAVNDEPLAFTWTLPVTGTLTPTAVPTGSDWTQGSSVTIPAGGLAVGDDQLTCAVLGGDGEVEVGWSLTRP